MHISIEEVLKHLFASSDNIQTLFLAKIFYLNSIAEFSLFGGPLAVLMTNLPRYAILQNTQYVFLDSVKHSVRLESWYVLNLFFLLTNKVVVEWFN